MQILSTNNTLPVKLRNRAIKMSDEELREHKRNWYNTKNNSAEELVYKIKDTKDRIKIEKGELDKLWDLYKKHSQNKEEQDKIMRIIDCYVEPVYLRLQHEKNNFMEALRNKISGKMGIIRETAKKIKI